MILLLIKLIRIDLQFDETLVDRRSAIFLKSRIVAGLIASFVHPKQMLSFRDTYESDKK
jgi:hypothetical protein